MGLWKLEGLPCPRDKGESLSSERASCQLRTEGKEKCTWNGLWLTDVLPLESGALVAPAGEGTVLESREGKTVSGTLLALAVPLGAVKGLFWAQRG